MPKTFLWEPHLAAPLHTFSLLRCQIASVLVYALETPVDSFVSFFVGLLFLGHCLFGPDRLTRVNSWYELTSPGFRTNPFPTVLSCLFFGFSQLSSFIDLFLTFNFPFGLTDPFVLLRPPFQPIKSPLFIEGGDLWFLEDACTKVREPIPWAFSYCFFVLR
jgi:hypothetical protein